MTVNIKPPASNLQHSTETECASLGRWTLFLAIVSPLPIHGETNALAPLAPPYGEMPPTFWEQHGTSVVLAGLSAVALAGFIGWLILRPRQKIIIPPEAQARAALEDLRQRPEDGVVLSRVSQVLRNYFVAAFKLAPGEFTTAEFNRLILGHEQIGAELIAAVVNFQP